MKKCGLFLILFASFVNADRGMIPVTVPNISIYESGQKAIIAWDGKREFMILTVDAYADTNSKVLEILPLPSEPDVRKGDIESFKAVQKLITKHAPRGKGLRKGLMIAPGRRSAGVEIIFHKKIGAHNLTCAKALKYEEFVKWVYKFLESTGMDTIPLPYMLSNLIYGYLRQDIVYFVFDIIELGKKPSSVSPLIYEFDTPFLFFPLCISRLAKGETKIRLFLLTHNIPWSEAIAPFRIGKYMSYRQEEVSSIVFNVNREELNTIEPALGKFLKDKAWFTALEFEGPLRKLRSDLKLTTFCNIIEY